ncbi:MAG TPA: hypothetical protein PKG52_04020 [bacterium]|nr:hypothetical protein [bacterium]HPS29759.1 hypothetical protein [bacterium]
MLVPFERNLYHISDFNGSYITTLLNDVFRFENMVGGVILCVLSDKTGYILFKNNRIVNLCAFTNEQGADLPRQIPFQSFFESSSIDIYVNAIEDISVIDDLNAVFNMPVMFSAPSGLSDIQKLIRHIEAEKLSGVLGFRHGSILNTALFTKGGFSYLAYYHSGTKSYTVERTPAAFNTYLAANEKLNPYIFFKKLKPEHKNSIDKKELGMVQNDPILSMFLCYVDIFDIIFRTIKERMDENKLTEICSILFKSLRDKYYPLYSTVSYSREAKTVNWNALYNERKYISSEYRFAHYHLYLDELLKLLLKITFSIYGQETDEEVLSKVRKYMDIVDKSDINIKEMTYRVDKILEKLK